MRSTFSTSARYSYALTPSATSSWVSACTYFSWRPPRIPPASLNSSMAISAPLRALLPTSVSRDPINPTTIGPSSPFFVPLPSSGRTIATTTARAMKTHSARTCFFCIVKPSFKIIKPFIKLIVCHSTMSYKKLLFPPNNILKPPCYTS